MDNSNSINPDKKVTSGILTVPKLRHCKTVLLYIMNTRQLSIFFSTGRLGFFPYFGCSVNSVAMTCIRHPSLGALKRL